jgi:hypothetical protein
LLRSRDGGLKETVVAGALIAITMLTKTFYVVWPIIATVWLLIQRGSLRTALNKAVVLCATVLVLFGPWVARNYLLFGTPRATTTDSSLVFWVANSPSWLNGPANGGELPPVEWKKRWPEFGSLDEISRDRWMLQDGLKTVSAHRRAYLKRAAERVWIIWKPFIYVKRWTAASVMKTVAMAFSYTPVLLCFLASIYLLRREWRTFALPYALIAALTASFALVHGVARYRVSLEPLLIVQAAYAFDLLLSRLRQRSFRPSPTAEVSSAVSS